MSRRTACLVALAAIGCGRAFSGDVLYAWNRPERLGDIERVRLPNESSILVAW